MKQVETEERFQQLRTADIRAAMARLMKCGAGVCGEDLPNKEEFVARNPGAQDADADIFLEVMRISTIICEAAKRNRRMPYFRPRWPIEALALSFAKMTMNPGGI